MNQSIDCEVLRVFCKVAELENFSRAAVQLEMAQPVVTRKMKRLEEDLGVELFVRTNRGCQLTQPGKLLAAKASGILIELAQLREEVMHSAEDVTGSLAIGMTHTAGSLLAAQVVSTIASHWPRLHVSLTQDVSRVLVAQLLNNELSLAVLFDPPTDSRLVAVPLLMERLCLVGKPGSPLLDIEHPTIADLVGAPLILPTRGQAVRQLVEEAFAEIDTPLQPIYETNSTVLLNSLAAQGLGYTLLTYGTVAPDVAAGRVAARPLDQPGMSICLTLATTREHHRLKTVRFVSELIQREIRRLAQGGFWQGSPTVVRS
ncbi:HTH-type transcriptional regulator BbuR [Paraburkholderia unamae]|uniref:LysR family transcriptional regulator n=1 Tax=Paraburkholderia unamae TaxID=219649 RepID=UPI000DC6065D|nr:LysR family transcriptional regulator [Paraburkholderia unamae]RAR56418.1 LysR family transcriptional regulator [Paraburkholderia unamae]CAG9266068.1 HTH-type transcriptional regulator BbuR [Paraburkholderia unamae]